MKFHVITLFPNAFSSYFGTSIMKKALEGGFLELNLVNLADFSVRNTRRSDDRPYGGFPGTILAPEPLERAIEHVKQTDPNCMNWYYLEPRGEVVTQNTFENLADPDSSIGIICGHYEWIDERVLEYYDIKSISLGEYVISSGELASMVFVDGIVRLLPGLLSPESLAEESFSAWLWGKKEYPHYTRPEVWKNLSVPKELLSGNPRIINEWKKRSLQ